MVWARIIGAASSVQFNVDCWSVEEALAVLNYAFIKKRIDRDRLLDHIKILDLEERQ